MSKERHLKSKHRESWTPLRIEPKRVIEEHHLQDEFSPLDIHAWQEVKEKIWNTFIDSSRSGWLWERLKSSTESIQHPQAFLFLDQLMNKKEPLWFFINETVCEHTKYWFYTATIQSVKEVLMESVGIDEFYIVSKKYEWLFCFNHHDLLIGCGELIEKELLVLKHKLSME